MTDQTIADNTRQFRWIVTLKENLDARLPDFVAGDLLWYPVEGEPKIRIAPDVLVALGRPKGDRGSYKQWEEAGVAPQVVFEILSPGNSMAEMVRKGNFYATYGVKEFYVYDPDADALYGWQIEGGQLAHVAQMYGWTSPLLGIRFERGEEELEVYDAEGLRSLTFSELRRRAEEAGRRAAAAERQAAKADRKAAALAAKLRELGVDPEALLEE
jgi:Uma2 family endonuclease